MTLYEQIAKVLEGIDWECYDQDRYKSDRAWWPTSEGAAFGSSKLKEIKAILEDKAND